MRWKNRMRLIPSETPTQILLNWRANSSTHKGYCMMEAFLSVSRKFNSLTSQKTSEEEAYKVHLFVWLNHLNIYHASNRYATFPAVPSTSGTFRLVN